jgi:hypothetical protein
MGWWPFGSGKGDIKASKLPGQQQQQHAQDAKQLEELLKQTGQADNNELLGGPTAKPTSIFEFGEPVPVGGDVLRGMCAGADPDAIHACTWTVEQAQGRGRQKQPKYRVEF